MSLSASVTQEATGLRYGHRLFSILLALAVLSVLIGIGGRYAGKRIALGGHTDSTAIHEIVIDNDVLTPGANMIRMGEQRRNGVADRLDLYLSWPALNGYNTAERDIFNGTGASPRLVFLSFEERAMTRDMSGRYEPIYKNLIEGKGASGPDGLTRYVLPAKVGYLNEVLYAGPETAGRRFVARCSEQERENLVAACELDLQAGNNLSATLRFPIDILAEWRAIDAAIPVFISKLVKTSSKAGG